MSITTPKEAEEDQKVQRIKTMFQIDVVQLLNIMFDVVNKNYPEKIFVVII